MTTWIIFTLYKFESHYVKTFFNSFVKNFVQSFRFCTPTNIFLHIFKNIIQLVSKVVETRKPTKDDGQIIDLIILDTDLPNFSSFSVKGNFYESELRLVCCDGHLHATFEDLEISTLTEKLLRSPAGHFESDLQFLIELNVKRIW